VLACWVVRGAPSGQWPPHFIIWVTRQVRILENARLTMERFGLDGTRIRRGAAARVRVERSILFARPGGQQDDVAAAGQNVDEVYEGLALDFKKVSALRIRTSGGVGRQQLAQLLDGLRGMRAKVLYVRLLEINGHLSSTSLSPICLLLHFNTREARKSSRFSDSF